jgi:hypothetical protein
MQRVYASNTTGSQEGQKVSNHDNTLRLECHSTRRGNATQRELSRTQAAALHYLGTWTVASKGKTLHLKVRCQRTQHRLGDGLTKFNCDVLRNVDVQSCNTANCYKYCAAITLSPLTACC